METQETRKTLADYQRFVGRKAMFIYGTILLIFVTGVLAVTVGSASSISVGNVLEALTGGGEEWKTRVIWQIRLPRIMAALVAGVGLSVSGAAMQSILRNPLGSPYTLGISSAAAFGAAFAVIILGAGTMQSNSSDAVLANNPYTMSIMAFVFASLCTGFILLLSRLRGSTPEMMVLAGIAMGSLFSAGLTGLEYFANDVELSSIVFWQFGNLGKAVWRDFYILAAVIVPVTLYFLYNAWNYNALDSGDETARALGVKVERIRSIGMLLAALSTALVVSFFGIIGFVGLVVPHIVRRAIGGDERFVIPASALFGGAFLLIADTAARTVIAPIVLPVGVLTSFLGAPLFLYLLVKGRDHW